ncbi:hypothetical protein QQ045_022955 [Rhodiola kirilowii]
MRFNQLWEMGNNADSVWKAWTRAYWTKIFQGGFRGFDKVPQGAWDSNYLAPPDPMV